MADTLDLQNSINWATAFVGYAPLNNGASNEPAITTANAIMQTILSPPFYWRWNRTTLTFNTVIGQQDYPVTIANYGYFELGAVAIAGQQTFPLEYKDILNAGTEESRPTFIADQLDTSSDSIITFRVLPIPDQVYTITITYQEQPPSFTALTQLWTPIPDRYEFVYNWGFLALMADYIGDPRAARYRQMFVGSLLGVSEGLSESERALFIQSWLGEIRQESSDSMKTQMGWKGRTL